MAISAGDSMALSQAGTSLSELGDSEKARAEKVLIDGEQSCHGLEREGIHLLLIDDASRGLADVAAGRVKEARSMLATIKRRRGRAVG